MKRFKFIFIALSIFILVNVITNAIIISTLGGVLIIVGIGVWIYFKKSDNKKNQA